MVLYRQFPTVRSLPIQAVGSTHSLWPLHCFYCLCLWLFIALRADMSKQNFVWTTSVWKCKKFNIRACDCTVLRSLRFVFLVNHRTYWKLLSNTRKYMLYFVSIFFLKILLVEVRSVTHVSLLLHRACFYIYFIQTNSCTLFKTHSLSHLKL